MASNPRGWATLLTGARAATAGLAGPGATPWSRWRRPWRSEGRASSPRRPLERSRAARRLRAYHRRPRRPPLGGSRRSSAHGCEARGSGSPGSYAVGGSAPIQVTTFRPDPGNPGVVAYVAWIDQRAPSWRSTPGTRTRPRVASRLRRRPPRRALATPGDVQRRVQVDVRAGRVRDQRCRGRAARARPRNRGRLPRRPRRHRQLARAAGAAHPRARAAEPAAARRRREAEPERGQRLDVGSDARRRIRRVAHRDRDRPSRQPALCGRRPADTGLACRPDDPRRRRARDRARHQPGMGLVQRLCAAWRAQPDQGRPEPPGERLPVALPRTAAIFSPSTPALGVERSSRSAEQLRPLRGGPIAVAVAALVLCTSSTGAGAGAHAGGSGLRGRLPRAAVRRSTRARSACPTGRPNRERSSRISATRPVEAGRAATPSVRRAAAGHFPLIVFGHGYAITPGAVRGSAPRLGESRLRRRRARVPARERERARRAERVRPPNQPADMRFVIARLLAASNGAHRPLHGLIDGAASRSRAIPTVPRRPCSWPTTRATVTRGSRSRPPLRRAAAPGGIAFGGPARRCWPRRERPTRSTRPRSRTPSSPSRRARNSSSDCSAPSTFPPYTGEQPQLSVVERVSIAFLDHYLKGAPLSPCSRQARSPELRRSCRMRRGPRTRPQAAASDEARPLIGTRSSADRRPRPADEGAVSVTPAPPASRIASGQHSAGRAPHPRPWRTLRAARAAVRPAPRRSSHWSRSRSR